MLCEKLVQYASLYSHRITRINALQGRLVWARIRNETEESLLNSAGGGALSNSNLAYVCMSKSECRCILLLNCPWKLYMSMYMHMYAGICACRGGLKQVLLHMCESECVCVFVSDEVCAWMTRSFHVSRTQHCYSSWNSYCRLMCRSAFRSESSYPNH